MSSGAAQAKPTGARSPGGRSKASSAGSKVRLATKAISMPAPAISPSSETPRNSVGRNEKKPSAVVTAAKVSAPPTRRAARRIASGRSST